MKLFFLFLFIFFSKISIGQYFFVDEPFDSTYRYAKKVDPTILVKKDNETENKIVLVWDDYIFKSNLYVYYNSALNGYMTCLIPNNTQILASLIKIFDDAPDHVKVSETFWKVFRHNKVYQIKLLYVEQEKKNVFYFTRIE